MHASATHSGRSEEKPLQETKHWGTMSLIGSGTAFVSHAVWDMSLFCCGVFFFFLEISNIFFKTLFSSLLRNLITTKTRTHMRFSFCSYPFFLCLKEKGNTNRINLQVPFSTFFDIFFWIFCFGFFFFFFLRIFCCCFVFCWFCLFFFCTKRKNEDLKKKKEEHLSFLFLFFFWDSLVFVLNDCFEGFYKSKKKVKKKKKRLNIVCLF